jgi:hypothetical protein
VLPGGSTLVTRIDRNAPRVAISLWCALVLSMKHPLRRVGVVC